MKERKIGVTPNTQAVELSLSDFGYELPKSLIAQEPLRKRSDARLLVLERATGKMEHRGFTDITDYLDAGDCLVLNDTKVLRARLFGKKKTGGRVEVLRLVIVFEAIESPTVKATTITRTTIRRACPRLSSSRTRMEFSVPFSLFFIRQIHI